jgi:hypothetical protein
MSVDISVVTPTFRRPRQLGEAIANLVGQSGASVVIIVIDDSPEASARDIVESIGDASTITLNSAPPSISSFNGGYRMTSKRTRPPNAARNRTSAGVSPCARGIKNINGCCCEISALPDQRSTYGQVCRSTRNGHGQ